MRQTSALKRLSALLLRGSEPGACAPAATAPQLAPQHAWCLAAAGVVAPDLPPTTLGAAAAATTRRAGDGGPESDGGGKGGSRRMGPILLLPAVVAAGLGTWQLARRAEKVQQLEDRLAAMQAEPADLFAVTERLPEFSPVAAEGALDEANTIFVGPRVRSAMGGTIAGKLVVTPLRDDARGTAALVVRGWAPAAWEPDRDAPPRKVRITGVTRASESRGGFVPDNVPGSGPADPGAHWYWLEAAALARSVGLPPDTPLMEEVVDERPQEKAPSAMEVLGGRTGSLGNAPLKYPDPRTREELLQFPVMPQGHLNYAATWYMLAACIALGGAAAMRRRRPPITQPLPRGGH